MPDISFIIVSWNVRELLRRAIHSILADTTDYQVEIIVVDNASFDGTVDMLHSEFGAAAFPNVRVIANTENVGFTRANNQGLIAATSNRYLFLLNPDTELVRGATCTLMQYMDAPENQTVGIVGPQLVRADGSLQPSRRRFPNLRIAMGEALEVEQRHRTPRVLREYYMEETSPENIQDVDWVVGAAMFVRRAVYDRIGGLDERFFMYSEEVDWCFRAKQAGWRVVFHPAARVMHYEGKSSEQVVARRDIYYHSSKVRYFSKHYGVLQGELLRYFTLGLFSYRLLQEAVKYLLGHKRELRAQRVKAYGQVLASRFQ